MSLRSDKRVTALLITVAMISGIALLAERYAARQQGATEAPPPASPAKEEAPSPEQEQMRPVQGNDLSPAGAEQVWQPAPDPESDPKGYALWQLRQEVHLRFQQGIAMLQQRQYDYAVTAFARVVELSPSLSDAHINLGFAYLGVKEYQTAWDHFEHASNLSPTQGNAYYGMAMAAEGMGDLRLAMSGMRTFLHMSHEKTTPEIFINRARSALWEWEAKVGDGPWGPTRGIPPGFTEEELLRDGTGVGVQGMKRGESLEQAIARRNAASQTGGATLTGMQTGTGRALPAGHGPWMFMGQTGTGMTTPTGHGSWRFMGQTGTGRALPEGHEPWMFMGQTSTGLATPTGGHPALSPTSPRTPTSGE